MILKSMSLENFRQFQGKQVIVFATGKPSEQSRCITVLYGENGRGKTGIYRALMFGLYGENQLSQDEDTRAGEISLVNRHMLEQYPEELVKAVVEVEFSHDGCEFHVRRELQAMKKKNGEIIEQAGEALLRIQDADGNTTSWDEPQAIRLKVNKVLDYRVREYFLFDGEKIERLTRANIEQRREVAAGIRNLLNIDDLEKSISSAGKLCRELDQEVKSKSSGELQQAIQAMNQLEDSQQGIRKTVSTVENELKLVQREKRDTDGKLAQYQEIRGLVEDRKRIEAEKEGLEDRLVILEQDCRKHSPRVAFGLVKSTIQEVFDSIDAKVEKGDIPPVFRTDFIQRLIETEMCICGRKLEKGSSELAKIVEWMSKTPKSSEMDAAMHVWKQLDPILRDIPRHQNEAQHCLVQYSNTKDRIITLASQLETIAEQIGAEERGDAAELQGIRERLDKKHIELSAKLRRCHDELSEIASSLEELGRKRQALENDASIKDTLIRRSQMARDVRNALKDVYEAFTVEAANLIGTNATEIMHRILDEEGRRNLKAIVVEANYSLQMVDQWEGQFLANISAGQRQIMSIAFIASLAKAASGEGPLEMPLFMDTPFGRLSQTHRNNLIREIPNLASQWVLLATDTELRREEGAVLLDENRLGRFYKLEAQEDGTTQICEQSLCDVPTLLKATMEEE